MRSLTFCRLLVVGLQVVGLLMAAGPAAAQTDPLTTSKSLIESRQYDQVIELLEKEVAAGRANAAIYNNLGIAYNWKQEYEKALKNYRLAAKLDPRYVTAPLQILNHFRLYDEIIQIGEADLAKGYKRPTVLTALLNAYYDTKKPSEYQRVLDIVKAQTYSSAYDANYRLYILVKAEVRAGRSREAIGYVAQMDDKSLLQYMRTSDDFKPIASDPRFQKLTE